MDRNLISPVLKMLTYSNTKNTSTYKIKNFHYPKINVKHNFSIEINIETDAWNNLFF